MRPAAKNSIETLSTPMLIEQARILNGYIQKLSLAEIQKTMHVSEKLSFVTQQLLQAWTEAPGTQRAAIDSFLGDIYSGLQVGSLTNEERNYANKHMRILSGLYGILRPLDGIYPYRLELGYRFPNLPEKNLYAFWGDSIAQVLPANEIIIDLSAVEYGKTVTKFVDPARVISPRFLTVKSKTREPTFVVVHTKIARGAFAHWMITEQIETIEALRDFKEIGYTYNAAMSTPAVPVFVCQQFGGIGLSVRLS